MMSLRKGAVVLGMGAIALALAGMGSGAASAAEPSKCKLVQFEEYKVTMVGNEPLIDASINGHAVKLLFDTGSNVTLLDRSAAVELGMRPHQNQGARVYGIGGGKIVEGAGAQEFKLGNAVMHDMGFYVVDLGMKDGPAVGILGEDVFAKADIELDLADGFIRFFKPKDCGPNELGDQVVYWHKAYSVVPIQTSNDDHAAPMVTVLLNGKPTDAILDTGSWSSLATNGAAEEAGVTPKTEGVRPDGKISGVGDVRIDVSLAVFPTFTIGDETIKNAKLCMGDLGATTEAPETGDLVRHKVGAFRGMLLGADFIRAHRIYIARSQQKIYFSYIGGPIFQVVRPREAASVPKESSEQAPK